MVGLVGAHSPTSGQSFAFVKMLFTGRSTLCLAFTSKPAVITAAPKPPPPPAAKFSEPLISSMALRELLAVLEALDSLCRAHRSGERLRTGQRSSPVMGSPGRLPRQ